MLQSPIWYCAFQPRVCLKPGRTQGWCNLPIVGNGTNTTSRYRWKSGGTVFRRTRLISGLHHLPCKINSRYHLLVYSDSDDTERLSQTPSKPVARSLSDTKSGIAQVLADMGVVMKSEVDEKTNHVLIGWNNAFQLQTARAVKSSFEDVL